MGKHWRHDKGKLWCGAPHAGVQLGEATEGEGTGNAVVWFCMGTRHAILVAASLAVATAPNQQLAAQVPSRAASTPAIPDALSTETGGFLLAIPGVADDFVLFADGQWHVHPNGTARLSAYVQREGAVDRDFLVELTFAGRVDPGDANYPPAGSPITTLLPAAYAPVGPVDASIFHYWTQVTGTMTGLRAYAGASIDLASFGPAQLGVGANNKNVELGLALDLDLTVVQPPFAGNFAPTGPARLRANLEQQIDLCATHVDSDPSLRGNDDRLGFELGGVANDYLYLPSGNLLEADDGTATLTATIRRQSDYLDAWQLQLQLAQRVDPGDASHPPQGFPVQLLLPTAYATAGGAIDTNQWRYYTQVSGQLTGLANNAGGTVQLLASSGVQVGVGAAQGNVFFGIYGEFQSTLTQQPSSAQLTLTGIATLHASLATGCILPPPIILTGDAQITESVTQTTLSFTGTDLGFVEFAAIGPNILGTDDRQWYAGFMRVVDHETLELSIPQGLPGMIYPLRFLNATRASNQLSLTIQEPTTVTMQTETDRLTGEDQHWVTHGGNLAAPSIAFVCLSSSSLPSSAPGIVDLQLGNQFQELLIVGTAIQAPGSNLSVLTLPNLPASLAGFQLYSQTALLGLQMFPMSPSNATVTAY